MQPLAIRHILVPVDFSDVTEHAIEVAIAVALARPFDARLTLFHASGSTRTAAGHDHAGGKDDGEREAKACLERLLVKVKTRYGRVDGYVASGEPREAILEQAAKQNADLIVMGTHSRRGLSRALHGSVAERIVRTSPVPVLTVSGGAQDDGSNRA